MHDLVTLAEDGETPVVFDDPPTVPDTPTARKESASSGICFIRHVDEKCAEISLRIRHLRRIGTVMAYSLIDHLTASQEALRDAALSMHSWAKCEPSDDVRRGTLTNLGLITIDADQFIAQADSIVTRSR